MAYDPYKYIKDVYNAKVAWGNATTDEERRRQQEIADKARKSLYNNGYKDIADSISADGANAETVKGIMNSYAKTDKTKTRDYLYSLGKAYDMSTSEIDRLIGWDNDTGQVSFGGKVIGAPDAVVDGVSYWSDTSVLDNAFNDYISRTNTTRPKSTAVNQENESLFKKYNQEYEDLKNTNPFTTEEAKAILAKYDLAGLQGRDNAVASGGATNGGNIDSFSAANALRQQSALINQGQMAVLEAHNQKLEHARALLSDMGVNIDRVYNEDETAKNNEVSRDVATSEATGYSTDNQLKSTSSLWSNGELANTTTDYQAQINDVKVLYDNATTEADKQTYGLALKLLEMARNDKIAKTGSKEKPTYLYQSLVPNSNTTLTREQIASAERIAKGENDTNIKLNEMSIDANNTSAVGTAEFEGYIDGQYNTLMSFFGSNETRKREFITKYIKPMFDDYKKTGKAPAEQEVISAITDNTESYNIDVDDAMAICRTLGVSTDWLAGWEDRTGDEKYKGMTYNNV